MKKGDIINGKVTKVRFPNIGTVETAEGQMLVKNVLPGQIVECRVQKKRHGTVQGALLKVIEPSEDEISSACPHYDPVSGCGGCNYQTLPYEKQLSLKSEQVKNIIDQVYISEGKQEPDYEFEGILEAPESFEFRNKMEFSFGDEYLSGPLSLGMHKRGSFYDILTVDGCLLVDEDFRSILKAVLGLAKREELTYFHRTRQRGYLRHLLVRKAHATGEILIALVTSSDTDGALRNAEDGIKVFDENGFEEKFVSTLCKLNEALRGQITGIIHVINDSVADVVKCDSSRLLYGRDHIFEQLSGLRFKISLFSFFQTNSAGAQVLYKKAAEYCHDALQSGEKPVIFDLYSGTGTIAQMMASVASKVVGVEIVEEAVEAAKENAELNGLHNCEFVAGDVLKVIDSITEKPDLIILDPPRDGIHPKALDKILAYGVDNIVYISCKPTSLARDLEAIRRAGYRLQRLCLVDMFPGTVHVETCVLLGLKDVDEYIYIDYEPDHHQIKRGRATYREVKEYVLKNYGLKVSSLDIAQIKDKCGFEKRDNYNKGKEGHRVPICTPEKEDA
ncbi:MAG: 23S rRNA (uracil(1939)-C(5))-methyltransferase RlmD, partial [Lachnospiraceae bacterium]|nr:23S rRNA (uracil(1939)-C(5))-methyltransferase RlmD [Lachnospiraceae bacterium]